MRNFKTFAMIAALALGTVALAVDDSATLSLTNASFDTLELETVDPLPGMLQIQPWPS